MRRGVGRDGRATHRAATTYRFLDIDVRARALDEWRVLARVRSASLYGIEALLVWVEVDVAPGLPAFTTVGLPDSAVRESRDRVRAAIRNAGFVFPADRITVSLAPADVRKEGASFDLPIALGILAATGVVQGERPASFAVVGELGLDGGIRPVRGALAMALACRRRRIEHLLVPPDNGPEAAVVDGVSVIPVATLRDAVAVLNGEREPEAARVPTQFPLGSEDDVDFADVRGQAAAKRALEIAAAGGHNIVLLCSIPSRARGHPTTRQDPVDLHRLLPKHDLVDKRPQEPLLALRIQSPEAPKGLGAETADRALARLLGLARRGELLGLGEALLDPRPLADELFEPLPDTCHRKPLAEVQVKQALFLSLKFSQLPAEVFGLRAEFHLPNPETCLMPLELLGKKLGVPEDTEDGVPDECLDRVRSHGLGAAALSTPQLVSPSAAVEAAAM